MFKVNQKRPLREVISFLVNWNNPQRNYLVQVSVLGGRSLWVPDGISSQRSSWCWALYVAFTWALYNRWGVFPQFRKTQQSSPRNPQNLLLPTPVIERKGKSSKSNMGFLKKCNWEGKKVSGGRERKRVWGEGGSSALWIPSTEGDMDQVLEGSIVISTGD